MKAINEHLQQIMQRWAQHPIYGYLADSNIDPRQRLFVAPVMAYFAMCFRDLNIHAFRHEAAGNMFQEVVNEQTHEDEYHSAWFLADYHRVFDQKMLFTDAMKFLWGKEAIGVRRAAIDFAAMARFATPFERFIAFEAIEGHGLQLFTATAKAADDLRKQTDANYVFWGAHHLRAEENHGKMEKIVRLREAISAYPVSDAEQRRASELLELSYTAFNRYDDDLYRFATNNKADALIDVEKSAALR